MLEIGKSKTIIVRTKRDGKLQPVLENGIPITKSVPANVWRVTRDNLGGNFGPDRRRKLVVGLIAKDTLVLYPQGTRQRVTLALEDVYRFALRCKANLCYLERARVAKAKKAERLEHARIVRADKRLTHT